MLQGNVGLHPFGAEAAPHGGLVVVGGGQATGGGPTPSDIGWPANVLTAVWGCFLSLFRKKGGCMAPAL